MADLEEYAVRRDRRFLVRLVLALLLGAAAGGLIFSQMTRQSSRNFVAERFFGTSLEGAAGSRDAGSASPR